MNPQNRAVAPGSARPGTASALAPDPALAALPGPSRSDVTFTVDPLPDGGWHVRKTAETPAAWLRLCNERRVLERLSGIAGVPAPDPAERAVDEVRHRLSLVGRGGRRMWRRDGAVPLAAADLTALACRLARTLAEVHQRGVQHRNIHPGCVVWAGPGTDPTLVDFELASTSAELHPGFIHHSRLTGSLAYAAPEQSGRAGLGVDHRADLYALGATLYELACGHPPFPGEDPLALIHQHLAVKPVAPHLRAPDLPLALSAVIMHLLEKSPDQRYQSAQGLAFDLDALQISLARGEQGDFIPGRHDFADWVAAPSRLIGREAAQAALAAALDQSIAGTARCVLLSGVPGVGKTALLNTLRPLVTARRGWFVTGKFDQLRQDQDTDAVRQALRGLVRLLLAESEADLASHRRRLLDALGTATQALAAWLPELATLLAVAPASLASDDAMLAEGELSEAVVALLQVIASAEQPLVMVLDDLQWAAAPALCIVDAILQAACLPGLLLVGAYRAGEVDAAHPLQARLGRWDQRDTPPLQLTLGNLPAAELALMLAAMLRLDAVAAQALAGLMAPCTGGNPFDTVELVNALRREGSLRIAADGWEWDALAIQSHAGQGEVLKLLHARMAPLPESTRRLLANTACLGGEVSFGLLAAACGLGIAEIHEDARAALDQGLLVMADDNEHQVRFRHDRIQQAAGTLLGPDELGQRHLELARRLSGTTEFRWLAAEQYLAAWPLIGSAAERESVAHLFAAAGIRMRLVSHDMAERFSAAGLALLADLEVGDEAGLRYQLASERHFALYHLGRLDEADGAFAQVRIHSVSPLELVDAACLQISGLGHRARVREAVDLGLEVLAALGTTVPEALDQAIAQGLAALEASASKAPDEITEVRDPHVVAVAKLLDRLVIPTLQCDPALNAWLAVETHRLWDRHGSCASLVRSAALTQPLVLQGRRMAYRAAWTLSRRILTVGEDRAYGVATATARHVHAIATLHWFEPLERTVEQARLAHEQLLRGSDLQFACLTFNATAPALLETGSTLHECRAEVDAGLAFARRTGNQFAQGLYLNYLQLLRSLCEPTMPPGSFDGPGFAEADCLSGPKAAGSIGAMFHILRALSAAVFGDWRRVHHHSTAAQPLLGAIPGFYPTMWAHCLRAVAVATDLRSAQPELAREEARSELARHLDWIEQRSTDQPDNFLALARWIQAEQAWALGDAPAALRGFDAALDAAMVRQRPLQRALVCERAARCQLGHGLRRSAGTLLGQAYALYAAWGASAKCVDLVEEFPELRDAALAAGTVPAVQAGEPGGSPAPGHEIDLMAVVRASQLLSSETSLTSLTARVTGLMAAMTGATGVHLLARGSGTAGWVLLDTDGIDAPHVPAEQAAALGRLPMSALRYVERTLAPLVVDDATRDDRFRHDPYLAPLAHCSLLVLPVMSKGTATALLLLENRLTAGCFAADRLAALQLIAGQLAVSLENAQLYAALEARVVERTRELSDAQARLVDTARRAGMAEIATNVLHNVGNVLNSVNVSAGLVASRLRASKASGLGKAVALIRANAGDLAGFFTADEKGQRLPGYLERLSQVLEQERGEALTELEQLTRRIDHIKDIVATQQSYAGSPTVREAVRIDELVRDALQMNETSMARHGVRVDLSIAPLPALLVDRPRVLQILVNLLSNAKNACCEIGKRDGTVLIEVTREDVLLSICVSDNGMGIAAENLEKVFAHGFTTRKDGHGFGLHSCALAARDMGGTLKVHSAGSGHGARFQLLVPYAEAG